MSLSIKISRKLYSRLERHARGFDTVEQVIERLLDDKGVHERQAIRPKRIATARQKRDVTKYLFNAHEYGKGRLVLAVIREFVEQRDETSYDELASAWPKRLQGSLGVFARIDKPELDTKRYFFKRTEQVELTDCAVAICNQWGKGKKGNIDNFLRAAKDHEFKIVEIDAPGKSHKTGEKMNREKTLRGLVIQKWNEAGEPAWDYSDTRTACLEANEELQTRGLNPARKFREKIEVGDDEYLERWVMGCHFDWLNPRSAVSNG